MCRKACINLWLCLVQLCRLCSGILDVRNVLKHKVKLGLGTGRNRTHLASLQFLLLFYCFDNSESCEKTGTCAAERTTYSLLGLFVSSYHVCKWWKTQKGVKWCQKQLPLLSCCRCVNSDVAGGYSASMLDAVRRALDVSKILSIQDPEYNTLTFEEVFRLATLGGSQGWRTIWKHDMFCLFWCYFNLFVYLIFIWQSLLWIELVNSKFRASNKPCYFSSLGPGWPDRELWGGQRFWCTQSKRGCTWWTHWRVRVQRTQG